MTESPPAAQVLSLEAFCHRLATDLPPAGEVVASARLVEDVGFDSLALLDLAVLLEELAPGASQEFGKLAASELLTVESAYRAYVQASTDETRWREWSS